MSEWPGEVHQKERERGRQKERTWKEGRRERGADGLTIG